MKITNVKELQTIRDDYLKRLNGYKYHILVCGGAGCVSSGCLEVEKAVVQAVEQYKLQDVALVYALLLVLLQLAVQCTPVDAEDLGGMAPVAGGIVQDFQDVLPFQP
jgi:hypothetical protein